MTRCPLLILLFFILLRRPLGARCPLHVGFGRREGVEFHSDWVVGGRDQWGNVRSPNAEPPHHFIDNPIYRPLYLVEEGIARVESTPRPTRREGGRRLAPANRGCPPTVARGVKCRRGGSADGRDSSISPTARSAPRSISSMHFSFTSWNSSSRSFILFLKSSFSLAVLSASLLEWDAPIPSPSFLCRAAGLLLFF